MASSLAVLALAALTNQVIAFPALVARQDPNPYQPNPEGSIRAPCPGINTLANHGFINRNGQGITSQMLQQGFLDAFNMGFDATQAGADNTINLCSSVTGTTCTEYNLDILNTPHQIEHDGSMTRNDFQMYWSDDVDNHTFNQTVWSESLYFYNGAEHTNIQIENTARTGRFQEAMLQDAPGWFMENDGGSTTEHAFMLSTMNDPTVSTDPNNPQARLDWIDHWFVNEQLPTDLGWAKPTTSIPNAQITSLANAVGSSPAVTQAPTKRDIAPELLPQVANPAQKSQVQQAAASATAAVGKAPSLPNAYADVLTPGQWQSNADTAKTYVNAVQAKFNSLFTGILGLLRR